MRTVKRKEYLSREEENVLYCAGAIAFPFLVFILALIVYYIVPNYTQMECFFLSKLGWYCPGCGGTRALVALFKGRFLQSLWYHPLVLYCGVLYGAYMLTHTCEKLHIGTVKGIRFRLGYLYGAIAVILINFALKNVLHLCFGIHM